MRKPGIILLCGEPDPCAAVRTALEALGPGMRCEIWTVEDASEKLREAVREHDGAVWVCWSGYAKWPTIRAHGTQFDAPTADELVRRVLELLGYTA